MSHLKLPPFSRRAARWLAVALAVAPVVALFLLAASLPELDLPPDQSFWAVQPIPGPRPPSGDNLESPYERPGTVQVTTTPVAGSSAPAAPNPTEPAVSATGMPVTYRPAKAPGWLGFAVALLVILGAGALVVAALHSRREEENEIVQIARSALGDLAAARDWEDVVVRCYADMSTALSRQRGIEREQAMTPREFAARLERAGVPPAAVHTLTRLFEKARYGNRHSSTAESQQAVDALQAIMQTMENRR